MADVDDAGSSPAPSAENSPAGETKAQQQARLRREKRNAKIQAGGSARLSKISSASGRTVAAEAELAKSSPQSTPQGSMARRAPNASADDPGEVDISNMFQRPAEEETTVNEQRDLFRQMLAASGPPQQQNGGQAGQMPDSDDPMMRMMQQMMGGMGMGGGPGGLGGADPSANMEEIQKGLASMFSGEPQGTTETKPDYIWRVVHALFSLSLGLYGAFTFTFAGTEDERTMLSSKDSIEPRLFWIFATVEILLQTTRYYIDGGKLPVSGMLGGLAQILPEPFANYVRVVGRYGMICTTIISDALVIVFVLGCMAWWSGLAPS